MRSWSLSSEFLSLRRVIVTKHICSQTYHTAFKGTKTTKLSGLIQPKQKYDAWLEKLRTPIKWRKSIPWDSRVDLSTCSPFTMQIAPLAGTRVATPFSRRIVQWFGSNPGPRRMMSWFEFSSSAPIRVSPSCKHATYKFNVKYWATEYQAISAASTR